MTSEHDPLLQTTQTNYESGKNLEDEGDKNEALGPLEISRRTRWGILAGIWSATFLSVRLLLLCPGFY